MPDMIAETQHGYLVLADISGFTAFMAGTELEHSHEILAELLELIISRLTPVLTLASLEGDAVLAFAPESRLPRGETLLELVETTYAAFRDQQETIRRRTTCTCQACRAVPSLDLKFTVHHGDYIAQNVATGYELGGLEAILVRERQLKDAVSATTGWRGYALFTEEALGHMGMRPAGWHEQTGRYEHVGEVRTRTLNLHDRYQELVEARRAFVEPEAADCVFVRDFAAPPPVVWEWLNDPHKRTRWMRGRAWSAGLRPLGRTGEGASNHCSHGLGQVIETVLDWRPFSYFTVRITPPSGNLTLLQTYQLEPLPNGGGTRLRSHVQVQTRLPRWLTHRFSRWAMLRLLRHDWANLARLMAEETTGK